MNLQRDDGLLTPNIPDMDTSSNKRRKEG
jgi:hypothetical protein